MSGMFLRMALAALLALTAENVLFSGGMGFSRALRAARRPGSIAVFSLFVTAFSLVSALAGFWLNPLLSDQPNLRPAVLTAAAAAAYLIAAAALRFLLPDFYSRWSQVLALAAVNTAVLALPYVQQLYSFSLSQTVGFALGTGAAFFLASLILLNALRVCANPDMPDSFSGLPAMLIYVGILSMAFAGFTGGKVF